MTTWKPVRRSAMHHKHVALGAAMVERVGWQRPARYTSVEQEVRQLRSKAGLCDVSPTGKLSLLGDLIESFLSAAFPGLAPPDVGAVRRHDLAGWGGLDSVVLARLARDEIMVLASSGQAAPLSEALVETPGRCAHAVDLTSALAGIRITGPCSRLLLAGVTEFDLAPETFPDMSCAQTRTAEIHCILLRQDSGELPSYELYFGREYGEYMWDALLEAGEEYGALPVGFEAMSHLHQ